MTTSFNYHPLIQMGPDETQYRRLDIDGISTIEAGGQTLVQVPREALVKLTEEAFKDIHHLFRTGHLQQLRNILEDPEASTNDRFVAMELLKNASIASAGAFPTCQDTGTAIIFGKKGHRILTDGSDAAAFSEGVAGSYLTRNLRYSQMAPLDMWTEKNTGNNLPAQIEVMAEEGDKYELMFIAKGGGSANKTFLYQETRRLLDPERIKAFFDERVRTLGTTACPPYHLAIVIGGLSAEHTLKTVKLASTRYYDNLPTSGDLSGRAFRDLELEEQILELTRNNGIGAQFGGKYFCHDVRVIRLPRHGASLPVGIGVSCSADRQVKAKITKDGVYIEQLETDPAKYLPDAEIDIGEAIRVDLSRPMHEITAQLSQYPVTTPVLLSGTMIVARDMVHAAISKRIAEGGELPEYFKKHPIYYAGPAKTPEGYASGSFGPTTAARMDPYVAEFQPLGGSLVTLAKGNRSEAVLNSCKANGGFYLATVGGAAARVGRDMISHVEPLDFQDFGMEAVWKIEVKDLPAFIVIDNKGNDFFKQRHKAPA